MAPKTKPVPREWAFGVIPETGDLPAPLSGSSSDVFTTLSRALARAGDYVSDGVESAAVWVIYRPPGSEGPWKTYMRVLTVTDLGLDRLVFDDDGALAGVTR